MMLRYFGLLYLVYTVHCTCPIGFQTLENGDCYRTFTAPSPQQHAESFCEQEGGTLVQPLNAFVNAKIASEADEYNVNLWLGLTCLGDTITSCTFSDGNSVTTNSFTNFYPGYPNPTNGHCVFLSVSGFHNGKWISGKCNEQSEGFGCQVTAESMQPDHVSTCGSSYQEFNGFCYKTISPTPESTAETDCEFECGHLTSIHSQQENDFILSSSPPFVSQLRIGLEYTGNQDYAWMDGSISPLKNYSNFGLNDPNLGSCVAMSLVDGGVAKGKWTNTRCTAYLPSICKRPKTKPCVSFLYPSHPSITTSPFTHSPTFAPPTCSSVFSFTGNGTIYSPGYPANYSNGLDCEYDIRAPTGFVVFFTLTNIIEFKDATSAVSLYDSLTDTVPFLSRITVGYYAHTFYASTTSSMKVKFSSGSSDKYRWSANYTSVDVRSSGCNHGLLQTPGTITSPNYGHGLYDGSYPSHYNCTYQLQAPANKRFHLAFSYFGTDQKDPVSIYDGPDSNSPLLGTWSTYLPNLPPPQTSSSNHMFITFNTYIYIAQKGWIATFTAI